MVKVNGAESFGGSGSGVRIPGVRGLKAFGCSWLLELVGSIRIQSFWNASFLCSGLVDSGVLYIGSIYEVRNSNSMAPPATPVAGWVQG